ncbi:VOC family protein [Sneathiella aquimaris]|uniref:VOC family protein n=1 Tax=Sneathiella aquimaris TaxID=2599305 RepID=UPI00146C7628|nr:VOC family protein [Sneathiella aquimaris]
MIDCLDHLVLTVRDVSKTKKFYCECLEMGFETFGEGRMALTFGRSKINLHVEGKEFEPKAHVAKPGTADLCFIVQGTLENLSERLKRFNIAVLEGPVPRTGATGPITSLYVRDPDQNLVELSVYS